MSLTRWVLCGLSVVAVSLSPALAKHERHESSKRTVENGTVVEEHQTVTESETVVEGQPPAAEAPATYAPPIPAQPAVPCAPCDRCKPAKCKKGKADIETIKAKACCGQNGVSVSLRYEVELKYVPAGACELQARFTDHGRLLANEKNEPLIYIIPLDRPAKAKKDEMIFRGTVPITMAGAPEHMRVQADVTDRATGRILDHESTSVHFEDD